MNCCRPFIYHRGRNAATRTELPQAQCYCTAALRLTSQGTVIGSRRRKKTNCPKQLENLSATFLLLFFGLNSEPILRFSHITKVQLCVPLTNNRFQHKRLQNASVGMDLNRCRLASLQLECGMWLAAHCTLQLPPRLSIAARV